MKTQNLAASTSAKEVSTARHLGGPKVIHLSSNDCFKWDLHDVCVRMGWCGLCRKVLVISGRDGGMSRTEKG